MNPLKELNEFGQSIWYDNIRRALITSGELAEMMESHAVTGVTSNPVIFEKAISGGKEYDPDLKRLAAEGRTGEEIATELMVEDIRLAADVLLPAFEASSGSDGFVSIEVSPLLAYDTRATIDEAHHLHTLVAKPNVMIKVPATAEGIPAVEELVYEGINVNVTLLFSVERYGQAALAYLRGLERRVEESRPVNGIAGVASFFVSRVDTLVDNILSEKIERSASHTEATRLKALVGRTAVANAKLAYKKHGELFGGRRFEALRSAGARPQRLLWGSTGTKNPEYSDIKYVQELIGADTINTMPLQTLLAFADHGRVSGTLAEGLDEAEEIIGSLSGLGIDYTEVTGKLEADGVKGFAAGHGQLMECIASKVRIFAGAPHPEARLTLGEYSPDFEKALKTLEDEEFAMRLNARDPELWKDNPVDAKLIKNSLGWLVLPVEMSSAIERISSFSEEVKASGVTDVVLLGMGGSSLAPLVLAETFGPVEGYPALHVLDSTDPEAVLRIDGLLREKGADKLLFMVSSKSGSTIEPLSLFERFYGAVRAERGRDAGKSFVAITDPGTALEGFSKKYGFRRLFTNFPDIGGRFSALSYFGLVPAALSGIDTAKLLYHAQRVEAATDPCVPPEENPGLVLGAAMGSLALRGRDKLTFFVSEEIESFGLWIEQLVAESTGKEGKGIVPVTGEPLLGPEAYGEDRVFVQISLGKTPAGVEEGLKKLAEAGHPVIRIHLQDPHELGGEFYRWEVATAAAGAVMGINPFDQPDVELAKKLTMARLEKKGFDAGPTGWVELASGSLKLRINSSALDMIEGSGSIAGDDPTGALRDLFGTLGASGYVALLAYLDPFNPEIITAMRSLQSSVMSSTGRAVQFGFGPRYLHSTGQLHKGGGEGGLFIIVTNCCGTDAEVPGRDFTFRTLELSQALGDAEALDSRGRPAVIISVEDSSEASLAELRAFIESSLSKAPGPA